MTWSHAVNSLTRGFVAIAIALGALAAHAKDSDRKELEDAKKKQSASAKLRRLIPLLESKDESVQKDAAQAILAIPPRDRVEPLTDMLRNRPYTERQNAAKFLDGIKSQEVIKALVRVVLKDNIDTVRAAALETLKKNFEQQELVHAFWSAFRLKDLAARARAAEAIGVIGAGYPGAVEVLIQELLITWGATQRVHTLFADQVAYVRDYDIEIAQQAVIADPIPGTVTSGVVLDTTVLRMQEKMILIQRRVIGEALKNLTGQDFGDDAKAWARWWEKNKDDFASR